MIDDLVKDNKEAANRLNIIKLVKLAIPFLRNPSANVAAFLFPTFKKLSLI